MHDSTTQLQITRLSDLWIHTGTACNLECPFCLEGSKPGDTRLEPLSLAELQPYFDSAAKLGVERFAFTGGEPLIVKEIVSILQYALQLKPCLVFTNGTAPLIKRAHQLQLLKQQPQPLEFRVSLDYPDETLHDQDRGWGNFKRAVNGLKLLHGHGFAVSIARHYKPDEDRTRINKRFAELLRKHDLPEATPIIALPDFGRPQLNEISTEHNLEDIQVTMAPIDNVPHTVTPMCTRSRMVLKKATTVSVWACPLTDDDRRFDTGPDLAASIATSIALRHARCQQCLREGASY